MRELNNDVFVFLFAAWNLFTGPDSDISNEPTVIQLAEEAVDTRHHGVVV